MSGDKMRVGSGASTGTAQRAAQGPKLRALSAEERSAATQQGSAVHTAVKGDTLGALAKRHGVRLADLKQHNPLLFTAERKHGDRLFPGDQVVLPPSKGWAAGAGAAKKPAEAPAPLPAAEPQVSAPAGKTAELMQGAAKRMDERLDAILSRDPAQLSPAEQKQYAGELDTCARYLAGLTKEYGPRPELTALAQKRDEAAAHLDSAGRRAPAETAQTLHAPQLDRAQTYHAATAAPATQAAQAPKSPGEVATDKFLAVDVGQTTSNIMKSNLSRQEKLAAVEQFMGHLAKSMLPTDIKKAALEKVVDTTTQALFPTQPQEREQLKDTMTEALIPAHVRNATGKTTWNFVGNPEENAASAYGLLKRQARLD